MKVPEGKKNKYLILVEVTGEDILSVDKARQTWPNGRLYGHYYIDPERTELVANIFNTSNDTWSDNSIYRNTKGDYIKKGGKRFYVKDFV